MTYNIDAFTGAEIQFFCGIPISDDGKGNLIICSEPAIGDLVVELEGGGEMKVPVCQGCLLNAQSVGKVDNV